MKKKKPKLVFILGGVKSGKSNYALRLAASMKKKVFFIATAQKTKDDPELVKRIQAHQQRRPKEWQTVEEPFNVIPWLKENLKSGVVILDCLTVYLANLFFRWRKLRGREGKICRHIEEILKVHQSSENIFIIVSNEVGLGVIPANSVAREFADLQGQINQLISQQAEEVYFLAAGCVLRLK
jgi:adenosylcobinamide kinase/adenosylcobinamide-phosphate guanylyltransferase